MEWEEVRKEIVEEKGLAVEVADCIGQYVKLRGGKELLTQLEADPRLGAVKDAQLGLGDMKLLLQYCELFGVLDKVSLIPRSCVPFLGLMSHSNYLCRSVPSMIGVSH